MKDFSTVDMEELQVIIKIANSEQSWRTKVFQATINLNEAGQTDWALQELTSVKELLTDTLQEFANMLLTILLRDDVTQDAAMKETAETSLREAELLIISTHNRWFVAWNTREYQLEVDNPVGEPEHRRDRGEEWDDDNEDEDLTALRRRALKLNFDGIRTNITNERFT
jgi:hypothetical protein